MNSATTNILLADVSGYLANIDVAKGSLFGARLDPNIATLLYMERMAVNFENTYEAPGSAVSATGTITVNATGNDGDNINVHVNDPLLGSISLGIYTKVSGDTTTTILATNIAASLSTNIYRYAVTSNQNVITITAPLNLGATVNGGGRLTVTATTVAGVNAYASYNATSLTGKTPGDNINVSVADPILGTITLCDYTYQASDVASGANIATHLNTAISANIYGYTSSAPSGSTLVVTARTGLGTTLNGIPLLFTFPGGSSSTNFAHGVNGIGEISNTITQFSGGVTAVLQSESLNATSNYLYALCGKYALKAANIIAGGVGGNVITPTNPTGFTTVRQLYFLVNESDGYEYINSQLIGLDVFAINRDGVGDLVVLIAFDPPSDARYCRFSSETGSILVSSDYPFFNGSILIVTYNG